MNYILMPAAVHKSSDLSNKIMWYTDGGLRERIMDPIFGLFQLQLRPAKYVAIFEVIPLIRVIDLSLSAETAQFRHGMAI